MTMNTETVTRRQDAHPERMSVPHAVAPRVDIYENADEFFILVDLPGVAREQLRIEIDKGQLVLQAERKLASDGTVVNTEFGTRTYQRVFALPRGIDAERVGAELKNGVLTLRLPKIPAIKPRRIEIKTS
jgi:HSP20 family molecular chaperone IbpA